jgi:methylated-DNA-protein-cysteine methyltransferase related protein
MSPSFTSPPEVQLFHVQVWELVRQVPRGKVATYGQIAGLIPPPDADSFQRYRAFGPRWVGGAMAACPDDVPWHRVINSQGKISTRRLGGETNQRQLLEDEGIEFDQRERVDLKIFGWQGPVK